MMGCQDCSLFAKHVASQAQGGALEVLNNKQRRHWRQAFEGEFKKGCDESFRLGLKKGQEESGGLKDELEKLRDKLSWYYDKTDNMEAENKHLQHKVRRLREDLRQVNDSRYSSASRGGARAEYTSHDKKDACSPRQSSMPRQPSPIRTTTRLIDRIAQPETVHRTPSPKQRGEDIKMSTPKAPEKETGETEELAATQAATQPSPPHNKMAIDPTPRAPSPMSDASSNVRAKGTGKKLPQMFVGSDADDDDISARGYEALEEDNGPAQPFKYVGPPAEYRLDQTAFHRMTVHGHVCVESPTHWDTDVKSLYDKWDKSVMKYVWNTGFPSQMAREASKIPFDQRSHAQ
jgi:hypothetical protein